jgi:hypothetical protein
MPVMNYVLSAVKLSKISTILNLVHSSIYFHCPLELMESTKLRVVGENMTLNSLCEVSKWKENVSMYLNDNRRMGPIYIPMNQWVEKANREEYGRKLL